MPGNTSTSTADGFVSKLSPDGTLLLVSTSLDLGVEGVAVDSQTNGCVTEGTASPITVTRDGYQNTLRGPQDAFC